MEGENVIMVEEHLLVIKKDKCLCCAACPPVCPTQALHLRGLELEIIEALCNNCAICIRACPVGAIGIDATQ